MSSLLVIVPTRGRRAQCERLLESFTETKTGSDTDIVFVTDPDDQDTYEGTDWGEAMHGILDPRESLTGKLNNTATAYADSYDALMFAGDDHVFRTDGWDDLLLKTLAAMGGSGWVYPDDKRRSDIPEIWMTSADVIAELGWFAPPYVKHFYCDNIIAELGKRSNLIRFCPEAVVEHLHYSVSTETVYDKTYRETETAWGSSDFTAFREWRSEIMPGEVARLRRKFSPDVQWLLGKV